MPGAISANVAAGVDGHRVATLKRPRPARPWTGTTFSLDGSIITVVGIDHDLVMHTDVFVDGISLRDVVAIDVRRASTPPPLSGYERWFNTGFVLTHGRLLPRWLAPVAAGGVLGVLFVGLTRLAGLIGGGIVLVASWLLLLAFVRFWFGVTVMAHRWLLAHPGLGDARRAVLLAATFLGIPLVLLGIPTVLLVAFAR